MLKGKSIILRPVRETDIDPLYMYHLDIDNRGDYFPPKTSEPNSAGYTS